ncbi:hypothetical protein [Dictyoglomus thermophilum]|nr:hypothetical protein [Dictyoglomus thermophilum]
MYYVFPIFKVRRVRFSKFLFLTCTILFNMAVLFLIFKYLGISFNFDLSLVYEIRSRYVESNIPFAGYLFNWVGYAINPLFLSYVFNKRQWLTFIFSIFIQLLLFSQTGLKSFLFVPILVLGVNWLYQKYGSKKLYLLTTLLIGLTVALGILSYFLMGDIWVSSLLTRRTFYVPALLSFYYYDFFTSRGFTYLAQHRLFGGFLKYPYSLNPPHLIGSVYFGTPEMGANNGILGDSYMNFGFLGAILWSFVLILFFKILDSFCDMDKNEVLIGPLAVFANAFTNSALLTVMTTHGFLILLLFSIIIPKNRIKYRSEG